VLSGRGLCDELITRPEESYRLCCVVVCDLETSRMGAPYIEIYIYDISRLRVKEEFFYLKYFWLGLKAREVCCAWTVMYCITCQQKVITMCGRFKFSNCNRVWFRYWAHAVIFKWLILIKILTLFTAWNHVQPAMNFKIISFAHALLVTPDLHMRGGSHQVKIILSSSIWGNAQSFSTYRDCSQSLN